MKCRVRKVTITFTTHISYPLDHTYTSDNLPDFDAIATKRMQADDGDGDWDVSTEDAGFDQVDEVDFNPA